MLNKYLITGANGQLGNELKRRLDNEQAIFVGHADLDVSDANSVFALVKNLKPSIIISAAAYTNVDKCETDTDTAFAVNALGARNLAVAANKLGAKIVQVSTDYVFGGGGDGTVAYKEYDNTAPKSIYGKTKLSGENYVCDLSDKFFIVRTAWLYGLSGNNFVKTILKAAKSGNPLKIVNDQTGSPTSCADLADSIVRIADTDEYGIYHATSNGECTWYEFAREFLRLAGLSPELSPCTTKEFPRPAPRPKYSVLDNSAFRLSSIGDVFPDWHDAIEKYIGELNGQF